MQELKQQEKLMILVFDDGHSNPDVLLVLLPAGNMPIMDGQYFYLDTVAEYCYGDLQTQVDLMGSVVSFLYKRNMLKSGINYKVGGPFEEILKEWLTENEELVKENQNQEEIQEKAAETTGKGCTKKKEKKDEAKSAYKGQWPV